MKPGIWSLFGGCLRFGHCALLTLIIALPHGVRADGIPEPSLVLYGVITDPSGGGVQVTSGSMSWVFQPGDGSAAFTLSTVLTNINNQFSYVLRVPCETQLPGLPVSTGVVALATSPTSYNRSQVTVGGVPAGFLQPAQTNLTMFSTDRGRIERVDLTVNLAGAGLIPDAWQIQYFGHTGLNPYDDPTGKGMTLYADYRAGTNPLDPRSLFKIIQVSPNPTGAFIVWSSVAGKFYTLQRATSLVDGFSDVQLHVTATAPTNTFHDLGGTGGGPYFYRIQVE